MFVLVVSHLEGSLQRAMKHYSSAIEGQQKHVLAAIGLAQMQMLNGEAIYFWIVNFPA